MDLSASEPRLVRFGLFELDLRSGELRKAGARLNLPEQPLRLLTALLEQPGDLVTRDELRPRLWPGDTFVDFEHGLNAAVKRLRDTLGDSADTPRFIETVPRRGYRFIAPVENSAASSARMARPISTHPTESTATAPSVVLRAAEHGRRRARWRSAVFTATLVTAMAGGAWWAARNSHIGGDVTRRTTAPVQRKLARLTLGAGLQTDPTWSPDGQSIAYASNQGGNFDIWVQPLNGGTPVQVTRSPAEDTQPTWSPDGSTIVFRSERDGGGLFAVPVTGGLERRLTTFGVQPKWAPDGSQVLFGSTDLWANGTFPKLYVVALDGQPPRQILKTFTDRLLGLDLWAWHPDGRHITAFARTQTDGLKFFKVPISGGSAELASDLQWRGEWGSPLSQWSGAWGSPFSYEWSPAGNALYFVAGEKGLTDFWRSTIDPQSLAQLTTVRLTTTGSGLHTHPAISPDGTRLAFTTETPSLRLWSFTLNTSGESVRGEGTPITDAGAWVGTSDLTRDGRTLAYVLRREGTDREELGVSDLQTGLTHVLASDDQIRGSPRWSRDGTTLAYMWARWKDKTQTAADGALVVRTSGGEEKTLSRFEGFAFAGRKCMSPDDWSPDGQSLLVTSDLSTAPHFSLYLLPLAAAPHAETAARLVASDPKFNLWQSSFSPDGRWIAFVAQSLEVAGAATVAVMPGSGADSSRWRHLTDARGWADKPRWSPDGKLLYFILRQNSLFNVWAVRFDSATGQTIGRMFQVTHFAGAGRLPFPSLGDLELSVSRDRVIVPIWDTSGSIWVLDNVDR